MAKKEIKIGSMVHVRKVVQLYEGETGLVIGLPKDGGAYTVISAEGLTYLWDSEINQRKTKLW